MKSLIKILVICVLAGFSLKSEGQKFILSDSGTAISIKGTSSLHDWVMKLEAFNSAFQLNREGSLIKGFDNITFSCRATDIKSEYSLMDKKTYSALKADDFPEIKFISTSVTALITGANTFTGNMNGRLNVAGESRDVNIPFKGILTDNNTINIEATTEFRMSSFNIIPPAALMGTLKTGDQVSVQFSLHYVNTEKQNNLASGK